MRFAPISAPVLETVQRARKLTPFHYRCYTPLCYLELLEFPRTVDSARDRDNVRATAARQTKTAR